MKIQDPNTTPAGAAQSSGAESARRAESVRIGVGGARSGSGAVAGPDQVELSGLSGRLGGKLSELATDDQPPEKAARLAEVGKLVESGQYEVPARQLASRIIDDAIAG